MDYKFVLPDFEGPLDLLLHLIKKDNINILDIDIVDITNQYLEYLNNISNKDLDIASEYLVLAAELIEIKARELLPKENINTEENEEFDPKEQLINRLLEYESYKESTKRFEQLEALRHEVYTKEPSDLNSFKDNEKVDYGVSLEDLINAITNFWKDQELHKPLNTKITTKEYSVEKRAKEIRDIVFKKKKVSFLSLLENNTKEYLVVTFLSILNLSKKQEISLKQDDNFKEILILAKEQNR